jgi:signal transduction histidine kinase
VTHELRGPLAALSSAIDVVDRRRDQLPEQAVIAVDALASQVRSFNQLVLDLLEISRFDAGAAHMDPQPIDVAESVRAMCDELAPAAEVEVQATDTIVMGDPRRLRQVVANLLQNADLYAGGVTNVAVTESGGLLRIEFADRGPGVPEQERQTIFGRFARGEASQLPDAPRGSGLGLALVAEHITLHGGRVWVEDRDGGGARFVVEIPARQR